MAGADGSYYHVIREIPTVHTTPPHHAFRGLHKNTNGR